MAATLLITGGTGFLGRRLALALKDQYRVVLTGRNNKQNMMAQTFTGCEALPMDVARSESIRDAFAEVRPTVVIHAAATKFVDLAERQPMECVDVNVLGSQNVARLALEFGVEKVIGISTDKAAPPVRNTYGLTKALMERVYCSMDGKTDTQFACARYGNVAWSTGSVLPIWKRMHETTGVIGTTGPDMTRFFFTVDDAVKLVTTLLSEMPKLHGQILSRQMKSAKIRDLLETWVRARGGRWEAIEGRPGERDDELLVGASELPFTATVDYDGHPHYVISFKDKAKEPLSDVISSANATRLSDAEMLALIDNIPIEER